MSMEKVPMTAEGYAALEAQVKHLKSVERPQIIQAIAEARAHGDLSENAEYHAAKEAQGMNEARVSDLEDKLSRAEVIDISKISGDTVKFGAHIKIEDEDTGDEFAYQIVGEVEADVKNGKLGINSPIARALINKKAGESVEVTTPRGVKAYKILKIRYGNGKS
jgi:transcription elongation factor GreA